MSLSLSLEAALDVTERRAARRVARSVERAFGLEQIPVHVDVALLEDDDVRALNADYRGKDAATDVLSFPAELELSIPGAPTELGALCVAAGVCRRQARALGHGFDVELSVLLVHGVLHLLDFDHERGPAAAREMAEHELSALDRMGVDVGRALIARSLS